MSLIKFSIIPPVFKNKAHSKRVAKMALIVATRTASTKLIDDTFGYNIDIHNHLKKEELKNFKKLDFIKNKLRKIGHFKLYLFTHYDYPTIEITNNSNIAYSIELKFGRFAIRKTSKNQNNEVNKVIEDFFGVYFGEVLDVD